MPVSNVLTRDWETMLFQAMLKGVADPEMNDASGERFTDKLPLENGLPAARFLRTISPESIVDPDRAEIRFVAEAAPRRSGDVPDPEVRDIAPEIAKINKINRPDIVHPYKTELSESPKLIDPQLGASFENEVTPELDEGFGHLAQLARPPPANASAPSGEESPVQRYADTACPALSILVLVARLQFEGQDVESG